jgi:predicted ATPase
MAMRSKPEGLTALRVSGFKSISESQRISLGPLTILAGANSSGKSSMMQPLLLLKQTLEANFDPGALLLDGPNVKFASFSELLTRTLAYQAEEFSVAVEMGEEGLAGSSFGYARKHGVKILRTEFRHGNTAYNISEETPAPLLEDVIGKHADWNVLQRFLEAENLDPSFVVEKDRAFLRLRIKTGGGGNFVIDPLTYDPFAEAIQDIIHLPGLRGNPERAYPATAVEPPFPGTFESYVASVIADWQSRGAARPLRALSADMLRLGLASEVVADAVSDTQIRLMVSRRPAVTAADGDLVNIADVGVGVSQTLPILVALITAEHGQVVYIEQPEIHLHPRAQVAFAEILADAARRGVRVVVETHSSLLLLGIQTVVAERGLPPEDVHLHWFSRRSDGTTVVTTAELDAAGSFGEWPEDFADVSLHTQDRYLSAAEHQMFDAGGS